MSNAKLDALAAAHALLREGKAAQAVAQLETLVAVHADDLQAWFALGQAQGALDRHGEAERAFREAVRLRPQMHEAHFNLALSLAYQDKLGASVEHFVRARAIEPNIPGLDATLLEVLLRILQEQQSAAAATRLVLPPLSPEPLVSVIMPTRDRPLLLCDALQSLCDQSYVNWEAIVVNDGAADPAAAIAAMGAKRAQVRCLNRRGARGQARARNDGLAAAQGAVITFLDDDDLFKPEHVALLVAALRDSGAAFAYSRAEVVRERLDADRRIPIERGPAAPWLNCSRALLLVRNCVPICNWAVRRECIQRFGGFDESLACAEDWELLLRYSAHIEFHRLQQMTAEVHMRDAAADSVSTRNRLRPVCELLYRRYDTGGDRLIELARKLYLASLA